MDSTNLAAILGLLIALSAASERLVEIVKGLFKWLDKKNDDERMERWRKATLQVLAVGAGIGTTLLARPAISAELLPDSGGILPLLALGFLASGGSGLWNSVLTYVLKVKDIKDDKAKIAEEVAQNKAGSSERADAIAKLN